MNEFVMDKETWCSLGLIPHKFDLQIGSRVFGLKLNCFCGSLSKKQNCINEYIGGVLVARIGYFECCHVATMVMIELILHGGNQVDDE